MNRKILLGVLLATVAAPAHACLGDPRAPLDSDIERYPLVVDVTVTGVHLSEFESYVLQERGFEESECGREPVQDGPGTPMCIYVISSTPEFDVRTLVDHAWKGEAAPTLQVTLGGCNVREPSLRSRGLVFVDPETGDAKAVWDSQFPERVEQLRGQLIARFGEPPVDAAIADPSETTSHAPKNLPEE